jgi:hypothetical protein
MTYFPKPCLKHCQIINNSWREHKENHDHELGVCISDTKWCCLIYINFKFNFLTKYDSFILKLLKNPHQDVSQAIYNIRVRVAYKITRAEILFSTTFITCTFVLFIQFDVALVLRFFFNWGTRGSRENYSFYYMPSVGVHVLLHLIGRERITCRQFHTKPHIFYNKVLIEVHIVHRTRCSSYISNTIAISFLWIWLESFMVQMAQVIWGCWLDSSHFSCWNSSRWKYTGLQSESMARPHYNIA